MIAMFGPAGSGKSTQGQILAEMFGWKWLSVGQVLRNTGEFEEILKEGNLVNDDTVLELMQHEMEKADADGKNVILDGFPRNEYQAKWAAKHILDQIDGMILLEVPKEELAARVEERGRSDDTPRVLEKRLAIYYGEIEAIKAQLAGVKVVTVDGVGTVEEVTERLERVIKDLVPGAEEQVDDVNGDEIEKSYGE